MRWKPYVGTLLIVMACTIVAELMQRRFDLSNLTMIYLLGVVVAAIVFGRGPAMVAAVLGVALFDFAFVPPRFTFGVDDTQYLVTFTVMLIVAAVIGTLTASVREQLERSRVRERRIDTLYRLSQHLAACQTSGETVTTAVERIGELLDARVTILSPDADGRFGLRDGSNLPVDSTNPAPVEAAIHARSVTGVDPAAVDDLYVPLVASGRTLGFLCLRPASPPGFRTSERIVLIEAIASQTAQALERCALAEDAQRARALVESERSRSTILSSVSHDLRTPLAAITGAATSLSDPSGSMTDPTRRELAETIADEARRLNRLIGNLLDMTSLDSGAMRVRKEWHSLEEVIGAALAPLEPWLGARVVRVELSEEFPLIPIDELLFESVVRNLIENAHKYSPPGEPIEVRAWIDGCQAVLEVADRGPGLPPGGERQVFDKFYRGPGTSAQPGVGLGLAICRSVVVAHGGVIEAMARPGGGTAFRVHVPLEGDPPVIEREPSDALVSEAP